MADARGGDATAVRGALCRRVRETFERRTKPHPIAAAWGRVMPEACLRHDDRATGLPALDSARGDGGSRYRANRRVCATLLSLTSSLFDAKSSVK